MDGVVRMPSAFSITFGVLPSITATHEFVVPEVDTNDLSHGPLILVLRQVGWALTAPRTEPLDSSLLRDMRRPPSYRRGAARKDRRRSALENAEVSRVGPGGVRVPPLSGAFVKTL